MVTFQYTVREASGIHARPAGQLVKKAMGYTDRITIVNGQKSADLKRLFAVLSLEAGQGSTVTVQVEGANETATAAELEAYMQENL